MLMQMYSAVAYWVYNLWVQLRELCRNNTKAFLEAVVINV